jgi:hypothetical protein
MAKLVNKLMEDEININFFCRNETTIKNIDIDSSVNDRNDMLEYYVIKKGDILKHKKLSKANPHFLEYLFNDFNLTDHLEKKFPGNYFYDFLWFFFIKISILILR